MITKIFNNKLLPFYFGAWVVLVAAHFFVAGSLSGIDARMALTEALVFNIIFALLGIGIWFLVKISDYEKLNWREMILRHTTSSTVSILIWFGASFLILGMISGQDSAYMKQLNDTLVVRVISGLLLYIIMVTVFYLLLNNQTLKERRTREKTLQNLLHESELNSLRAQIKPHFLFNSLNSISSLTITNPAKAQEMVINLSEFMRYSLSLSDSAMSTLRQELYHLRLYLEIEKVRFGGRLSVEEIIDEKALEWPLPPMILQPLVENAVKHGVYDTPGQSHVKIECGLADNWLTVTVINNYDPDLPGRKGTGTGLVNVMKRMNMVYGMSNLALINKTESYFEVKLKFPANVKDTGTHR